MHERPSREVALHNSGCEPFEFCWDAVGPPPLLLEPACGTVAAGACQKCQIVFCPASAGALAGQRVTCRVLHGRTYTISLTGAHRRILGFITLKTHKVLETLNPKTYARSHPSRQRRRTGRPAGNVPHAAGPHAQCPASQTCTASLHHIFTQDMYWWKKRVIVLLTNAGAVPATAPHAACCTAAPSVTSLASTLVVRTVAH